ncbi:RNase adapter RapZ [Fusibacter bizertensis]|uniref:RNase adapter RapZ n=1 Tax=Fusibacter bizertensis TaxID=1488331 RepID=A0ABT6NB58_9FIRM|nr:RNase adapter RapZ [Fusibacter bizertensis]MDH8677656.1 RNase adapter RapZ [Fusibacter bizertensis]
MNFIIISGQSGAGKSQAKKVFEDIGFYCIDNLPPSLIPNFIALLEQNSENINNVALVIDIRGGKFFKDLEDNLTLLKQKGYPYQVFYFEADDQVILKRFKETRRTHPLDPNGRIEDSIQSEKKLLAALRAKADFVINTNTTTQSQLKNTISKALELSEHHLPLHLTFVSFGFKKGLPQDADFLFDVRFLPNPYYIEELRALTGNEIEVSSYVMGFDESKELLLKLTNLLDFIIPNMIKDGRSQLVIAIGCTGGQHRSVTFANALTEQYQKNGYSSNAIHRDARKEG